MNGNDGRRLNKFISDSGYCSRREADAHIAEGAVTVNGQKATLGTRVNPGDVVKVGWHRIKNAAPNKADRVYIAYNKPRGITCTTDPNVAANIVDAIRHKERIYPVGRLDNQSEGLIFLTSDGDIVNKILRVGNAHEKEYVVTVDKPIKGNFAQKMAGGIPMLGTVTKPCTVNVISDTVFKITLTQGLNRQIRRMCEYLGYEVVKLKRVRIMSVKLGTLKTGEWRNLTDKEMAKIHKAIATSDNSADVSAGIRKAPARKTSPRKKPGQPRGDRAAPGKTRGKPGGRSTGRSGAKAKSPTGKKAAGGGRRKPGRRK
ncbi:MAG: 23S rRNA pseudouridine(2604) synthase RluF [Alcanivoracaceae bacterium]|nr:23S rRNA pseudouridine(2604) synthase RluF [Alcanivoracaceae bacterium]